MCDRVRPITRYEGLATNQIHRRSLQCRFSGIQRRSVSKYFVRSSERLARERTLSVSIGLSNTTISLYEPVFRDRDESCDTETWPSDSPAEPNNSCVSRTFPQVPRHALFLQQIGAAAVPRDVRPKFVAGDAEKRVTKKRKRHNDLRSKMASSQLEPQDHYFPVSNIAPISVFWMLYKLYKIYTDQFLC